MEHFSPFTWQLVGFIDTGSFLTLYLLNFKHYSTGGIFYTFPPRPFTMFSSSSPVPLPYWYRPHRSTTKSPVLFLHGIGVPPISFLSGGRLADAFADRATALPPFHSGTLQRRSRPGYHYRGGIVIPSSMDFPVVTLPTRYSQSATG